MNLPVLIALDILSALGDLCEGIFSALEYQLATFGPLRFIGFYAYIFLIFAIPLVFMFGRSFEEPGVSSKIKTILIMMVVIVFGFGPLIMFSYFVAILVVLFGSLISGIGLFGTRRSLLDIALFFLALVMMFVPLPPIDFNGAVFLYAYIISKLIVLWGIIEAARGYIYPLFSGRSNRGISSTGFSDEQKSGGSKVPIVVTVMIVALFALSIFSQEIYGAQEPLLTFVSGTVSDYAFIAGAVIGGLLFIIDKIIRH